MTIRNVQDTWNRLGSLDPMWAILTERKDAIGNRWSEADFFATGVREIDSLMHDLNACSPTLSRRRALDFGCGIGRLSRPLAGYFDQVVGVDIARTMIDLAEAKNIAPERCRFILNESDRLDIFERESFSFIYSNIVLQHMPTSNAEGYLREFARILERGGLLAFQIPGAAPRTPLFLAYYLFVSMQPYMPRPLLDTARRLRYRGADPAFIKQLPRVVMEMHGMSEDKIMKIFSRESMELMNVCDVGDLGFGWRSFRYIFRKL